MKKIQFTSIICFFALVSIYATCRKHLDCRETVYNFEMGIKAYPDKDSIQIGDTIWLEVNEPTTLKDVQTGNNVDYSKATIGSTLSIGELISGNTFPRDGVFDFDYVPIKGRVYNDRSIPSPDGVQQLSYEEINERYELKIGIIPKKKGLYGFGVGNGFSTGRNKKNVCEKASFNINLINTNQHFYLYQQIDPGHQTNDYESKHTYYFKVK